MQLTPWISSVAFVACLMANQQAANNCLKTSSDPYYTYFVRAAMDFFKESLHRGTFSGESKAYTNLSPSLPELGDRVSVAVLEIYSPEELVEPENANAYLTTVRNAFVDRSRVVAPCDRQPNVTHFVLDFLHEKEQHEEGLRRRIEYLNSCVGGFSCSSQGEFDFFHKIGTK